MMAYLRDAALIAIGDSGALRLLIDVNGELVVLRTSGGGNLD